MDLSTVGSDRAVPRRGGRCRADRPRFRCVAVLVVIWAAVAPAPSAAGPDSTADTPELLSLATSPVELQHDSAADRHDYVVRCETGEEVVLEGEVPGGFVVHVVPLGPGAGRPSFHSDAFVYAFEAPATIGVRLDVSSATAPQQVLSTYHVRCLPEGFPELTVSIQGASQADFYLVNRGRFTVVVNSEGTPVWWVDEGPGRSVDAKLIDGRIVWSRGSTYVFRDWEGAVVRTIATPLDHHDLQQMPSGDVIGFQYLTSERGLPEEARLVAIDPSGAEVWSWLTEDHIAVDEMVPAPYKLGAFAHVNAVEPHGDGQVVMSARSLDALYDIDMASGEIVWKLGGTPTAESLAVSDGERLLDEAEVQAMLAGPHDPRFLPDGTLSVLDNGSASLDRRPRVLRFQIDLESRVATIVDTITDDRAGYSGGTGSARLLSGGHWVITWGLPDTNDYFTEMTAEGDPILTVTGLGSYRAVPVEPGALAIEDLRAGMDAMAGSVCAHLFTDVPVWAEPAVDWARCNAFMNGFGAQFKPLVEMNRAQVANLLYKIAGAPDVSEEPGHGFGDVPAWVDDAVTWLVANDYATGYPSDNTFRPHKAITRAAVTRMLFRIADPPIDSPPHAFIDVPSWVDDAVSWITDPANDPPRATGFGNRFKPLGDITRAQATRMACRSNTVPGTC